MEPSEGTDLRGVIEKLPPKFRSGTSVLSTDFFAPCLAAATSYDRAAGFFTSSALITWAAVLPRLAARGLPHIRLLAAPYLSPADKDTLEGAIGEESRRQLLQRAVDGVVEEAVAFAKDPSDRGGRARLFAWFVAHGRLEIRFVVPIAGDPDALYHEKFGILAFPWGSRIAFTGSANETRAAHTTNFESIDVFREWLPHEAERVHEKALDFSLSWENKALGALTMEISPEVLARVRAIGTSGLAGLAVEGVSEGSPTDESDAAGRWRHQLEAIAEFLEKRRGILEMATGTGKTRTAIEIARRLIRTGAVNSIVVAADGNDLMDQWCAQLVALAREPEVRFSLVRSYERHHESEKFQLSPSRRVLVSSRLALPPALRSLTPDQAQHLLLIHDEVHRLGSPGNRSKLAGLSKGVGYTLGLSATPEREYDQEGSKFIEDHVGPIIYRFGLEEAIRRGVLCEFDYAPLTYAPTQEDRQALQAVFATTAARRARGEVVSQEEVWIQLARIYKTSRAKLPLFQDFVRARPEVLRRCIVFVETMEFGAEVIEIIHSVRADFHTYYAEQEPEALRRFARGEIECLVTCHRLSEGIDIQSLANVVLFSASRARLETIQRLGRCLRVDPSDPGKRALVVDFVRADDRVAGQDPTADEERREWLTALARTVADNSGGERNGPRRD